MAIAMSRGTGCTVSADAKLRRLPSIAVLLLAACVTSSAFAATLRFASGFDPQSIDPHALALLYQTRVVSQIYESLVFRDRKFAIEPALAVSWQQLEPTRWRFKLRPNVKFHDGTPFTADDVVFSIERALHEALAALVPAPRHQRGAQGRRSYRRLRARRTRCSAARRS